MWLGNLDYIFYLDLSKNSLSGSIPLSLTRLKSLISTDTLRKGGDSSFLRDLPIFGWYSNGMRLQYKQYLNFPPTIDLSNNMITGSIPEEFGNLKLLQVLDLSMQQ